MCHESSVSYLMEGPYIIIIWCQYLFVAVNMEFGERSGGGVHNKCF